MKRTWKHWLSLGMAAAAVLSLAGCGGREIAAADSNPDTPIEAVTFPLKEKAELSFITNAPARTTQDPNARIIFQRLEEQTNVHIDWTCFVSDQFSDKKT